ncbi:MAG TPA: selenoneine biosynthesis selenosugar synthase SenB [Blastocatellia bacterium]|nr:selenoneine biosynthesis selenosugar synthase SenB [Blastocatellia bacterium]
MKIGIVTPAPPRSRYGNRVTAMRWAGFLKTLGHSVRVIQTYNDEAFDLLIALHARRSHPSIARFHREHPDLPIIVVLTGTDLYKDLGRIKSTEEALDLATRIVVLQPKGLEQLAFRLRPKTKVIHQSVVPSVSTARAAGPRTTFDVCVVGHLRPVKDPFRTAMASRTLPESSRIRVVQIGGAMTNREKVRAKAEVRINARYQWLGEQSPARVRKTLERCQLFVLSSKMEGGANALGEAIVTGVPVLASRIPGSIGILGEDYPGYFETGNTRQLARLMLKAETDPSFLSELNERCEATRPLFSPAIERASLKSLVAELSKPA